MNVERTAWAEGMGLDEQAVEEFTEIAEEANRLLGEERPHGFVLPTDDTGSWGLYLEEVGLDELATLARRAHSAFEERAFQRGEMT